jgi:hypothetical protein
MSEQIDWYAIIKEMADKLEKKFRIGLNVNRTIVDEIDTMAAKTIEGFNQKTPSVTKVAGNAVFWIKKLKPLNRVPGKGSGDDYLLINELASILVGVGICNMHHSKGAFRKMSIDGHMVKDMAASLRYHSYSPNSIAMIFESLAL